MNEKDLDKQLEKDKKTLVKMFVVFGVLLFLTFGLPLIFHIKNRGKTVDVNADNLIKENVRVEQTADNQNQKDQNVEQENQNQDVIDNTSIENSNQIQEEQQQTTNNEIERDFNDPFYSKIHSHINALKHLPAYDLSSNYYPGDNYITNAVDDNGNLHVFKKKPILIYVPKNKYYDAITQAFVSYNYQFKGLLSFQATNDPNKTDIKIIFKEDLTDLIDNESIIGVGVAKEFDKDGNITYSELYVRDRKNYTESMILVYNVILHEIGHCIGILGHSPQYSDLMYRSTERNDIYNLHNFSNRDIETIKLMYSNREDMKKAFLANAKQDKLQENLNYAKEMNNSDSYLAVADSYYNLGQYEKALDAYRKAMELNPNNYKIYVKLAFAYIKAEKYDDALVYLKYAVKKADDKEMLGVINDNIAYIYAMKADYENALMYYEQALINNPAQKTSFFGYMMACYYLNKKDLAIDAYNKYIGYYKVSDFDENDKQLLNWVFSKDTQVLNILKDITKK